MGARKRNKAEERKELRKTTYSAMLRNCPTSPRKMRLIHSRLRKILKNWFFLQFPTGRIKMKTCGSKMQDSL